MTAAIISTFREFQSNGCIFSLYQIKKYFRTLNEISANAEPIAAPLIP
ncbi:MAG: hypothetical protein HWD62_19175 [Cyclobacteriaceae bacterium]|nr:MAG: hypothetical protein HWD62_19175 [Cyclobacteriaceae bacterium]